MYLLQVTHRENNPNYEVELKKAREENRFQRDYPMMAEPKPFRDQEALTVILTDEEYKAVKKAVLEVK